MQRSSSSATTRRTFLKASAAASAAIVIPSGVLAADGNPGANDRIGLGYIGCGRRSGQLHNHPGDGQCVATADCSMPRAMAIAKKYGGTPYQDYRKLLDSKDVDAVVIASPDHWHALHSIHACMAGKDVYVEKPMTLTIREGRQMVDAARKYKRIVQCGSQQRSMAKNRLGCELIRNGRIGKVTKVLASNYPSPWEHKLPGQAMPAGMNWDMWCGQTPVVPYNKDLYAPRAKPGWISFRPYSGGEVTGWGSHGFDQIQWALGADDTGPVEVWTEGEAFDPPTFTEPGSRGDGEGKTRAPKVFMRYASGTILEMNGGPLGGGTFIGEKGTISIDRARCVSPDNPELVTAPLKAPKVRLTVSNNHMQHWFDCMRSRETPITDVEVGHRSGTVCHLANIARWTGRRLQYDPVKETFPNDKEACALLERTQRKGYEIPNCS